MSNNHETIFTRKNQSLVDLYESAGHPKKVACVALDYAKSSHTALICNGMGKRLKGAFPVKNNPEGLAFMLEQVDRISRKHNIAHDHIFFGGEDCGTYALNFIHAVREKGFLIVGVDPKQAKHQRQNFQASTDKLDLLGIAKLLIDQVGSQKVVSTTNERALRYVVRHRAVLVKTVTRLTNRMHSLADQLFPGFLDETQSGIPSFSKTALWLMEDRFTPNQIGRRQMKPLIKQAKLKGLPDAEQRIAKLQSYANNVLEPIPLFVGMLQTSLRNDVKLYRSLQESIKHTNKEVAFLLAQVPGAMLTTIKGTGITLAAGVASEIGPPSNQASVRRLVSYAGIIPRVKQTGGEEGKPSYGSVARRSNHILKNYIVQCGNHMGCHGPTDLKEDHRRRAANGQHADFGMARRYLRIAMRLMRTNQSYVPEYIRQHPDIEILRAYYLETWPRLRALWKSSGALEVAFAAENPLGRWRNCIQELYQIELPLS
jgi:transposase